MIFGEGTPLQQKTPGTIAQQHREGAMEIPPTVRL